MVSIIKIITVYTRKINEVRYAIWYYLYSLKNMKNTHGGVLILVKLQALALIFSGKETVVPYCTLLDVLLLDWFYGY